MRRAESPTGGLLGLHGHGLRERQLRGPTAADGSPTTVTIVCRRYQCTHCDAVLTVVPRGVAPFKHYGFAAIAMALAVWSSASRFARFGGACARGR